MLHSFWGASRAVLDAPIQAIFHPPRLILCDQAAACHLGKTPRALAACRGARSLPRIARSATSRVRPHEAAVCKRNRFAPQEDRRSGAGVCAARSAGGSGRAEVGPSQIGMRYDFEKRTRRAASRSRGRAPRTRRRYFGRPAFLPPARRDIFESANAGFISTDSEASPIFGRSKVDADP